MTDLELRLDFTSIFCALKTKNLTQAKTIDAVRSGRIRSVVFQTYFQPSLLPRELAHTITTDCTLLEKVGGYSFHSTPPAASAETTQP